MTQYLLNFHHFPLPKNVQPSDAEIEAINQQWQHFIGSIAGQQKFVNTQRLDQAGSVIGPDGSIRPAVNDGKGLVVGTLTLEANDLEEAIGLAKGCPVLAMGGSVEVRPVIPFNV